mmetsp:Transcript_6367/g.3606  ORF Transcript_6367/g.3606 Transcript_6367/m.3606 type:complete len:329 (-) Transcript_6367:38-1024(-)
MKKTVSFSKNSCNIFFHILTKCNLKCRHCYINQKQHGTNTLSIKTINSWLTVFTKPSKENNLIILGGEPTLHPELPAAVKKARELNYTSITIDTNGYLFFDILSKVTPDEVDYFSFSLDGPTRETNDRIRGKGCFDNCIAGIKKAGLKGFNTSLIYTVSTNTIHNIKRMPELLKELKVDRFFIQVIGMRGNSVKENSLQVLRNQWEKIIPKTVEKIADMGIAVTYPKVYLQNYEKFECAGVAADNYFIFPNGKVYRCPLCEDFPLHSLSFNRKNQLVKRPKINEANFFGLSISEGCVMNNLIQPGNIVYKEDGLPEYKIACCMLKEEL